MGEKLDAGEIYKGPSRVFKDSNWLSAESIPADRDTVVQVEAVIRRKEVKFKDEVKRSYGSLRFKGKDRELGLNATNRRIMEALFGTDTTAWFGQWVSLYVDPHVSSFGQIVSAVRIRAKHVNPHSSKDRKKDVVQSLVDPIAPEDMDAADQAEWKRQQEEAGH